MGYVTIPGEGIEQEGDMTIEQLKTLRSRRASIETKREQIMRLRSAMEGMTQALTLSPRGGLPQTLEDKMIKLLDLQDELASSILVYEYAIRDALQWIDSLPPNEAAVMRHRYIDGLSWRQVARKVGYCEREVYRFQESALRKCQ